MKPSLLLLACLAVPVVTEAVFHQRHPSAPRESWLAVRSHAIILPVTSSFGARLRQHREERRVELSEIAAQTKIKVSLLEGLERDDLTHWPPGIFRRAYLRAYAHAIGLNPDTVVREFLEVYPEPPEIVEPGVKTYEGNGNATGGPPMRLRNLVGSAVGSLSRLRRGIVFDDRVRPQGTTGNIPAPISPPEPEAIHVPSEPEPPPPVSLAESVASEPAPPVVALEPDAPEPVKARMEAAAEREPDVDLAAAANLCTALGRVEHAGQMPTLLREAARILDAKGLIVWVWDGIAEELQPALVHGYSEKVL